MSVMEARGAVKRRPLTHRHGGQVPGRSSVLGHPHRPRRAGAGRYRLAGGPRPGAAFRRPVIECPPLTDTSSGL